MRAIRSGHTMRTGLTLIICALCMAAASVTASSAFLCEAMAVTADSLEDDDTWDRATGISINQEEVFHNFHDRGDEDWVVFYGIRGLWYHIMTIDPGSRCSTIIELYNAAGGRIENDEFTGTYFTGYGQQENILWKCRSEQLYYLRIRQLDPSVFGEETAYGLSLWDGIAPDLPSELRGRVVDEKTGKGIVGAKVRIYSEESRTTALTRTNGAYRLKKMEGVYQLTVAAPGYVDYAAKVRMIGLDSKRKDVAMRPISSPADLEVTAVRGPLRAQRGDAVKVEFTIKNRGKGRAGAFRVGMYLSKDSYIHFGRDLLLGTANVKQLAPAEVLKGKTGVKIPRDVEPGEYTIGVLADPDRKVHEGRLDNNGLVSKELIRVK